MGNSKKQDPVSVAFLVECLCKPNCNAPAAASTRARPGATQESYILSCREAAPTLESSGNNFLPSVEATGGDAPAGGAEVWWTGAADLESKPSSVVGGAMVVWKAIIRVRDLSMRAGLFVAWPCDRDFSWHGARTFYARRRLRDGASEQ